MPTWHRSRPLSRRFGLRESGRSDVMFLHCVDWRERGRGLGEDKEVGFIEDNGLADDVPGGINQGRNNDS